MTSVPDQPPIGVTVIGGYLGAGKTTLLNHILRSADQRIAVIVNDFGDVNIDADLIESADGDTISLANGCICCSLVDGFNVALDTIRSSEPRPERLVIEASGVGIPAQIAAYAHTPGTALDGVITVVDAETIRRTARDEYVGDVVAQQLTSTDLVVMNKVDLVDGASAESVARWLRDEFGAPVIAAENGRVDLAILLGLDARDRAVDDATLPAAAHFGTWTRTWDGPIERAELEAHLDALPDDVVRAKGIVHFADDPTQAHSVDIVGARRSIRALTHPVPDRNELVAIAVAAQAGDLDRAPDQTGQSVVRRSPST